MHDHQTRKNTKEAVVGGTETQRRRTKGFVPWDDSVRELRRVVSYFSLALTDATGAGGKDRRRRNEKRVQRREREKRRDGGGGAAMVTVAAVNYVFRVCYRETSLLLSFLPLQPTNAIFWSRHGNTTLSLAGESRKNLKLLCKLDTGPGEIHTPACCADRSASIAPRYNPETWFLGPCQFLPPESLWYRFFDSDQQ